MMVLQKNAMVPISLKGVESLFFVYVDTKCRLL